MVVSNLVPLVSSKEEGFGNNNTKGRSCEQIWDQDSCQEAKRELKRISHTAPGRNKPAKALILDCCPSELQDSKFLFN